MKPRPTPYQRDFRRLRSLAREILKQVEYFERNSAAGADDRIRGFIVAKYTREAGTIGRRLAKRYYRERQEERGN